MRIRPLTTFAVYSTEHSSPYLPPLKPTSRAYHAHALGKDDAYARPPRLYPTVGGSIGVSEYGHDAYWPSKSGSLAMFCSAPKVS